MTIDSLKYALAPSSIAIVGASENPNKIGGRPLKFLQSFGYQGQVWPINPGRNEAQGLPCFSSIEALPGAPDMAIVVVPGDMAVDAIDKLAARGCKVAVCMTSGFGETSDPEGKAKQNRMVATARAAGMRMIGPNCQGVINFANGVVASFSTMLIEETPLDGPIGIVSQSGAMSVVPFGLLRRMGLGVRYTMATGNDADVSVLEMGAAIAADPDIRLLLVYIESIPNPEHLVSLARIARARDLPIVALKSGRTPAGQKAAQSHTGALANEDRVVDQALADLGIWRARDVAGLVRAAEVYLKGWRPNGRRIVAISGSGATCVMTADAATDAGLSIAPLAKETRAALDKTLPTFATTTNPIDLTAALLTNNGLFGEILPILAKDQAADMFVIGMPVAGQGYDVDLFARDTAAFADETGKPVVVAAPQAQVAAPFKAAGIPTFPLEVDAVEAIAQLARHRELMAATAKRALPEWRRTPADAGKTTTLNEVESLSLLAGAGLPVVRHRLCRSEGEAIAAWRELGPNVVMKGCSREVPHKSEHGLVRVGVRGEAAVAETWRTLTRNMADMKVAAEGVIVAEMVKGRREIMIGAHRDAQFGPVIVIGDGGKYVEAMPDTALLLPPIAAGDVDRAIARLRIAQLFRGVRGESGLDAGAVTLAVQGIADLMRRDPSIASLDANPLIVHEAGKGGVLVDAVVMRHG